MTMRTTKSSVTFMRPFRLGAFGEQFPAGHYPTDIDGELPEGMSFPAYQRTPTLMHLMPDLQGLRVAEIAMVDPQQFEEAPTMEGMQPPASNIDPPKVEP